MQTSTRSLSLCARPTGASCGNCFESRVDAERTQQMTYVIAHRLLTEMEIAGDLRCRTAVFEQAQNLRLTRREVRMRSGARLFRPVRNLTENPDHPIASP